MNQLTTRTNLSALNDQQRKAVLSKEKRVLVLAGAGSGKTNTLLQKINYLINDEQADSNSILAITFTKNAANEMIDRMILSVDKSGFYKEFLESKGVTQKEISEERKKMLQKYPWLNQITMKTFHGLCYQIMRTDGVNVFDNQFKIINKSKNNSGEVIGNSAPETESEIIQKVTIKLSKNKAFLIKLKRYVLDYFVDYIGEDEEKDEFRPKGKFFTTLKGDKVRSKSEQFIADWLFRNSIEYKYEHVVRIKNKDFHPDFFIPQANLYLEHVSNLSCGTFYKEMEYKKAGISCVKTFDKATHNSAVFNHVLDRVIRGRISSDMSSGTVLHYNEEFAKFRTELKKFYRLVLDVRAQIKNTNKSIDVIAKSAAKSKHKRVRSFYEVAIPIIKAYDAYCINESYLDFDGLIEYALKLFKEYPKIKERYQYLFKYVMVDEFQDVNNKQVEFLKHLISHESQLFCVGDDWQSIYGFRGSEIDYIVNFKEHFENPEIITLNLNYRSTDQIVKASNQIIKKNKFQVEKNIKAVKKGGAKIEVHLAEVEGETESFIWKKVQQHIQNGVHPEEILILYRRSAMKENVEQALKNSGIKVQFKTIHGAKGLEAKVVFVLGLNKEAGGFPDPWMQDKIYHVIKKTEYDTLLEEERRLFYVALTRAKSHLYLMSQKGSISEFVKDIPKELILSEEFQETLIENKISICSKCESKIEEHFKYCPECGKKIGNEEVFNNSNLFNEIKKEIQAIPLEYTGYLDHHIYRARQENPRAYEPWSEREYELLDKCKDKFDMETLCELFGRSENSLSGKLDDNTIF
ncbi:hypothetical protein BWZ22_13105 [Seonamhaeicola sp. S2-3]|uniref:UvrD-helicase domain-containing protein n=1 Tax=Seonamhaeicola sp. S2-3 TaxID=1936081 RepID=UPI00097270BF|nr:UvrD-helicase domain-containing protein [Seonamhaeicola sp. S2-3]APY12110.1 hypothetical protein BWZ22_13105 [Seonamhaeicola sp. S2-3]